MAAKEEPIVQTDAIGPSRLEASWPGRAASVRQRVVGCICYMGLLTLAFFQPLAKLAFYAAQSQLFSYILLVPFVSAYCIYLRRERSAPTYRSSPAGIVATGGIGIAALAVWTVSRGYLSINDALAMMALAFLSLIAAGCFLFLGSKWVTSNAFPLAFLIFMIPLPDAIVVWLEKASVLGSSDATAFFFSITGVPVARSGTVFELPRIVLQVAQECSGIHSSLVLFISSLLASHLFLKTMWRKIVLIAFVIPLGILRNGFRILVIGLLCVHIGPQMIDSPIHHQGGPLFFVLSLGPLFLFLWWLRRQERQANLPC